MGDLYPIIKSMKHHQTHQTQDPQELEATCFPCKSSVPAKRLAQDGSMSKLHLMKLVKCKSPQ